MDISLTVGSIDVTVEVTDELVRHRCYRIGRNHSWDAISDEVD